MGAAAAMHGCGSSCGSLAAGLRVRVRVRVGVRHHQLNARLGSGTRGLYTGHWLKWGVGHVVALTHGPGEDMCQGQGQGQGMWGQGMWGHGMWGQDM